MMQSAASRFAAEICMARRNSSLRNNLSKRSNSTRRSTFTPSASACLAATRRHAWHSRRLEKNGRQGKLRFQSSEQKEIIPEPSFQNLKLVALAQAIPFIGFGFMDNAILIIAGDAIDTSLGINFGISTLCAAAIGNIISDLAGIGLGTMIEDFCANVLKLPVPDITAAQRTLRSVRTASNLGMAVGMTFGCILGMFPLWFIDSSKVEQMKKKANLEALFQDVVTEAKTLIGAESTCLYLRVHIEDDHEKNKSKEGGTSSAKWQGVNSGKSGNFLFSASDKQRIRPAVDGEHLYAMYYVIPGSDKATSKTPPEKPGKSSPDATDNKSKTDSTTTTPSDRSKDSEHVMTGADGSRFIPIGKGIVSRAVLTGEAWNIPDVRKEPDYLPDLYEHDGSIPEHLKHMIVVPVLDGQGQTIAVIRALNKIPRQSQHAPLSSTSSSGGKPLASRSGFTDADVQILKSLASHISVSLQSVFRDEEHEEMRLRDTIRILKEHGLEGIADPAVHKVAGRQSLFPTPEK